MQKTNVSANIIFPWKILLTDTCLSIALGSQYRYVSANRHSELFYFENKFLQQFRGIGSPPLLGINSVEVDPPKSVSSEHQPRGYSSHPECHNPHHNLKIVTRYTLSRIAIIVKLRTYFFCEGRWQNHPEGRGKNRFVSRFCPNPYINLTVVCPVACLIACLSVTFCVTFLSKFVRLVSQPNQLETLPNLHRIKILVSCTV